MSNPSRHPLALSYADWLYQAGVHTESRDVSDGWLMKASAVIEKPIENTGIKDKDAAPSIPHTVPALAADLPVFTDRDTFEEYLKTFRGIGLCKTATKTVLGIGPAHTQIMVIAESPDQHEDLNGTAFSAPAHLMVKKALKAAGFDETNLYYTYLSKWRPPGQRTLTPQEKTPLIHFLHSELALIRPKAILTLGESVSQLFQGQKILFSDSYASIFYIENHTPNLNLLFFPSQKGEFLVKTNKMKKNFWFGLLALAGLIRTSRST